MARPRVFISSTFFDLRQVRADLERFIKDLGYDPVRNETGAITYGKEFKLEEYCYKEISEIDILVGVVGGRFGSESDRGDSSITQEEIKTAIRQNKQVYIFIEKNVLAEYETYLLNKDNNTIKYRFANDIRIYKFIEEIYSLPKNNIVHPFETVTDVTLFLREQWAGLFRDLLHSQLRKQQYENIDAKVSELTEVSSTLRTYLESVLESVSKEASTADKLISSEKQRLEKVHVNNQLLSIDYIKHLVNAHMIPIEDVKRSLLKTKNLEELKKMLIDEVDARMPGTTRLLCIYNEGVVEELDIAKAILKLEPLELTEEDNSNIINHQKRKDSIRKRFPKEERNDK